MGIDNFSHWVSCSFPMKALSKMVWDYGCFANPVVPTGETM